MTLEVIYYPDGTTETKGTPNTPVAKVYTKSAFKEFCYGVLGTLEKPTGTPDEKLLAGIGAFGKINKLLRVNADLGASANDILLQVYDEYNKADTFDKLKTLKLLGIAAQIDSNIVSNTQIAALSAAWENV